ncbi:gamma-butyrobetaine hydroxylase-like domain-containing protein [Blastochloris viridis]|uniref:Gamma-butyrobetaine hydroxylase-like N-terminal domain-containing protein n=1 Tax=Blastochloris viridis TaxID=1079 RepID=A0A0H5BNS4_BLAVI|nr:DUF971 domain-containing protein [Blastochloris viridis]ALK08569.1 hypothetical protein BVIR_775 [Blastochloris viridis]BAR98143.1 hypothetical protein BV133_550 [Blastochloris viridis]CUU41232.1 hypothetical protein BVIRIDIS_02200 [Blastochloris viridis]
MSALRVWPTELRLGKDRRSLTVVFDNGVSHRLEAEYLRVESPSAEVRGHAPAERKTVSGCIDVRIVGIEPVGNYAVRISFDDGHSTGLYGWDYLAELGEQHDERWQRYLAELAAKGLSRETPDLPR